MKKLFIIILSLVIALFCAGCSSYIAPTNPTGGATSGTEEPDDPQNPDDPSQDDEGDVFSVTLMYGGKIYAPKRVQMTAQWTGEDGSTYRAEFNGGVASVTGLDGVYSVTVSGLPEDKGYNPTAYTTDNNHRDINVEVMDVVVLHSAKLEESTSLPRNENISISQGNIYRMIVYGDGQGCSLRFSFMNGLETWCDTVANDLNPKITGYVCNSVSGFVNLGTATVAAGGGKSSSFTKNIKCDFGADAEFDGLTLWHLVVESRTHQFPTYFDFCLFESAGRPGGDGGGESQQPTYTTKHADTSLLQLVSPPGRFVYNYRDTDNLLDASRFKLFEIGTTDSDGNEGDGYYHIYDSANDVYGAILFAVISKDCEIIESEGTNTGFLFEKISLQANNVNYGPMVREYAEYCNDMGAHPVTEELKEFLQAYATRERFFDDGNGWAEGGGYSGSPRLKSNEDNQWLFACGYYVVD